MLTELLKRVRDIWSVEDRASVRARVMLCFVKHYALSGLLLAGVAFAQDHGSVNGLKDATTLTALVPASPDSGFHHPYLLRLPTVSTDAAPTRLIVEVNNSGVTTDDFDIHLQAARRATEQGVGAFAANRLGLPLLVPAFPRPGGDNHNTYTHALDSDSLDIGSGPIHRLDLQLIAMIDDAIHRMNSAGIEVDERFLMIGFSASATFANRFSMIHPRRIAGLAVGGFNGILMLPYESLEGTDLPYPLGLSDYERRFGKPFDRPAWLAIPQFAFMGESDTNDAVKFDDAYSDADRSLIYTLMGETMQPDRWSFIQRVYEESGANFRAMTYPRIGHGTDGRINLDMAEFITYAVE